MRRYFRDNRKMYLALGLVAGLAISYIWPQQPARAVGTDRDAQFSMTTMRVSPDGLEAIFVLDYLTGQLTGGAMSRQQSKFMVRYMRNLSNDFGVDTETEPRYAVISGVGQLQNRAGRGTRATSLLYVGELKSGKVIAYAIDWQDTRRPVVSPIEPVDSFFFRKPSVE